MGCWKELMDCAILQLQANFFLGGSHSGMFRDYSWLWEPYGMLDNPGFMQGKDLLNLLVPVPKAKFS